MSVTETIMDNIKDVLAVAVFLGGGVASWVVMRMNVKQLKAANEVMHERVNEVEADVKGVLLNESRNDERMNQMVELQRETRRDVKELVQSVAGIAATIKTNQSDS